MRDARPAVAIGVVVVGAIVALVRRRRPARPKLRVIPGGAATA